MAKSDSSPDSLSTTTPTLRSQYQPSTAFHGSKLDVWVIDNNFIPSEAKGIFRSDLSELVEINVGPNKVKAIAYKSMLVERSGFFEAACHAHWETGKSRTVTLEDQDPDVFAIFVTWVLTGNVKSSTKFIEVQSSESEEVKAIRLPLQWNQLAKCYVLGDFLQAPGFKNAVIDMLLYNMQLYHNDCELLAGWSSDQINYIYSNTTAGSQLRRIIVELVADRGGNPYVRHVDYLYELAELTMKKYHAGTARHTPFSKPRCTFHEHPDQPAGYTCTRNNQKTGKKWEVS